MTRCFTSGVFALVGTFVGILLAASVSSAQQQRGILATDLREQIRELREETEALKKYLETLDRRLEALSDQIEADVADGESLPVVPLTSSAKSATTPQALVPPFRAAQEIPAERMDQKPSLADRFSMRQPFAWVDRSSIAHAQERQAYLEALTELERGTSSSGYRRLREALWQLVKSYPGGAYESKARYLIADSYYTEKRYRQATQGFLHYLKHFPHAEHVGDARLKLAHIRFEQGDTEGAVDLLKHLSESDNERIRKQARGRLRSITKNADE